MRQSLRNIFQLPLAGRILLYAPLHHLAALVNAQALSQLRDTLASGESHGMSPLDQLAGVLSQLGDPEPMPRSGDLRPRFLGLLPTRGCNMACRYCGFLAPEVAHKMPLTLARDAVNWYMDIVARENLPGAEVHFFGGEPFCGEEVIDLAVMLATRRAREIGCTLRFEVATNGIYNEARAWWIAENISTVVLSFDGPAEIQNLHRPLRGGQDSYETVRRSARIFSEGATTLCLRACVTAQTVARLPEIAAWFCREFRPTAVSFEPLQPTSYSENAGLYPPDPWLFAEQFIAAARVLESHGVQPVYATAAINARQVSFCPVANDVVIVSPDGSLDACYLLRQEWEAKGLDLNMGAADGNGFVFDSSSVARIRRLNVRNNAVCETCFCRWHCAGGCHVNHMPENHADRLCIQNRIITLRNILSVLGEDTFMRQLLDNSDMLKHAVLQPSDLLFPGENA